MIDYRLLNLIEGVLGTGKKTSGDNYAFKCPNNCHESKNKLEINLHINNKGENPYHCWICTDKLKGKKLINLFKKLEVSQEKIEELKTIIKYSSYEGSENTPKNEKVELPKEFKSLLNIETNNLAGRRALAYLKKRNITEYDILKYNIGYCESGPYSDRIVIPSYDNKGALNYFTSRGFEEYNSNYKNPSVSRNIIPFELNINWDVPIVLCEGPFDMFAIKRNVIPLLGKNIQDKLMKKIITSNVKKIYIALDKDAITKALSFCELLLNEGKEVFLLDLENKDPSELGFVGFTSLIQKTQKLTFSKLFEKKLQLV